MKDNLSPEEKLLRLIRQEKKIKPQLATRVENLLVAKNPKPDAFVHKIVISPFGIHLTANLIQNIMITFVVLSGIFLIFSLFYPLLGTKQIKLTQLPKEELRQTEAEPKEEIQSAQYYADSAQGKRIFGTVEAGKPEALAVIATDILKNITLIGIISGINPQAVIEDKKAQKTYYVTRGQFISDYQVEDIQEGKIILNYHGQKYELNI